MNQQFVMPRSITISVWASAVWHANPMNDWSRDERNLVRPTTFPVEELHELFEKLQTSMRSMPTWWASSLSWNTSLSMAENWGRTLRSPPRRLYSNTNLEPLQQLKVETSVKHQIVCIDLRNLHTMFKLLQRTNFEDVGHSFVKASARKWLSLWLDRGWDGFPSVLTSHSTYSTTYPYLIAVLEDMPLKSTCQLVSGCSGNMHRVNGSRMFLRGAS